MMIKKVHIISFFYMMNGFLAWSQETIMPWFSGFEAKPHFGFVLPHHESIGYNISRHVYGFELNTIINTTNRQEWQDLYRNPLLGVGLNHFSIDNRIYGSGTGLYGFADVPFIKGSKFSANYRLNIGMAYLNKIFHVDENNFNSAIGAHLNMYFRLGFTARYKLTEQLRLTSGLGMTHFSNGNLRTPNLGINIVSPNVGVMYIFNDFQVKNKDFSKRLGPDDRRMEYSVFWSAGTRTITEFVNDYYFMSTINFNIERYVNKKRKVGGGLDIFYDGTRKLDEELALELKNFLQVGIHLSTDVVYNRFSMSFQAGYYVYKKNDKLWDIYNRLAIKYDITPRMVGIIALKSHKIQADYIEWGVGYVL